MHVDWASVKSRPHFVAEELHHAGIDTRVLYVPTWRRWRLTPNPTAVSRRPVPVLPRWQNRWVRAATFPAGRLAIRATLSSFQPDVVLLTWPSLARLLPSGLSDNVKLYYDVVDPAAELYQSERDREIVNSDDCDLVRRADRLFTPSEHLRQHVARNYSIDPAQITVVRNAYDGRRQWSRGRCAGLRSTDSEMRLGYIGTVGPWVDLQLLHSLVREDPLLSIHFYGPVTVPIPPHPRLVHHGLFNQATIQDLAPALDAFVLPFVINDLTRCIDPIKLYEYLAMGRPVIARWYEEIARYERLISFYRSPAEFRQAIAAVRASAVAPDPSAVTEFLSRNTWAARAAELTPLV